VEEISDRNLLSQIQGLTKKMAISQEEAYIKKRGTERPAANKDRRKRRGERGMPKTYQKKLEHEYEERQEGKIDITV
jgi:hypothetical protein